MDDKDKEKRRLRRNKELLDKVKRGEDTALYTHEDSWWPPRPKIKKDPKALGNIFKKPKVNTSDDDTAEE